MVADMTTFMAKLVSKLTQTSINFANNIVQKSKDSGLAETESDVDDILWERFKPLQLNTDDLLSFTSNTQILDEPNLSIP